MHEPQDLRRRATRADVARAAGTSTAVVSYVINNGPRPVAPETRQRVLQAIEQTGYRRDPIAGALATGKTRTLGLVVPDIENPFYAALAKQLETTALANDHTLLLANSGESADREAHLVTKLVERRVDGVIIAPVGASVEPVLEAAGGVPIVVLDRRATDPRIGEVTTDTRLMAMLATQHLVEHGRTRHAIITGRRELPTAADRVAGWTLALQAAELAVREAAISWAAFSKDGGYRAASSLLDGDVDFDALFTGSEQQAIGALRALQERGVAVPAEVSIASVDGTDASAFTYPALSSIRQPFEQIAANAIERVLDPASARTVTIDSYEFVRRESCGCYPLRAPNRPTPDRPPSDRRSRATSAPIQTRTREKGETVSEDATTRDSILNELDQLEQTGYDVAELRTTSDAAHLASATWDSFADEVRKLPQSNFGYNEPSDLRQIEEQLDADLTASYQVADDLSDRLIAAWRGRVCGNMLGKPVEYGVYWTRSRIKEYLQAADAYPLSDYIPAPEGLRDRFELREDNWRATTRGNVDGSARDDDVDYTVLGLHILEEYGTDFTSADVATEWLTRLPFHQTYTAERAAYRNLVEERGVDEAAVYRNPYREWIGALIRGDVFGYVTPGDPTAALRLAYKDAYLSHRANGIYGEQWAAVLLSLALSSDDIGEVFTRSLDYVPRASRLHEAITRPHRIWKRGGSWEDAVEDADHAWSGYHWVHTVNNAAIIAAALLWGEGDFSRSIGLTVQGGKDTDSNGATVGSILGALNGTAGIPSHWTEPIHDHVRSAVFGFENTSIPDLARRTEAVMTR
ncbi:ADP-ribosylglycohydrolase family protein [Microlunatus soli]|uniref:DNA-binding transcriptional regulator, LacI/PurR family n=1 Tax=Microlunatus soli TaxID=630515 RepID=A0A1H1W8J8_9ACTN|nr:ADP-ribosylglycohydrolase family protein [Microlunatus soli]SDS93547.1 DNA-binding transcriptional regulator, LacI/PurR family [Microlunatus soli]